MLPLKHQDMLIRNSIRKRHLVKTMAVWRHEEKTLDGLLLRQFNESIFTSWQEKYLTQNKEHENWGQVK